MKLYAETPFQRSRQIAADAAVALWVLLWIRLGTWIHELVNRLAGAGSSVEGAEDLHLFALRAVATRPLYELQSVTPEPAAAPARGDYEPLASLELGALGLKRAGGH